MPQKVTSLFEVGFFGQLVDINAAVSQNASVAIDVANFGCGGDHPLQSLGGVCHGQAGHCSSLGSLLVAAN